MRAIVEINGRQYEIEEGRYVQVDSYPAAENEAVTLNNVQLIVAGEQSLIGAPYVEGATVKAQVKRHGRGPKVLVYKMRCKKGYRRKNGHRQGFTELQIVSLDFPGKEKLAPQVQEVAAEKTVKAKAPKKAAETAEKAPKASASKAAAPKASAKKAAPKKAEVAEETAAE